MEVKAGAGDMSTDVNTDVDLYTSAKRRLYDFCRFQCGERRGGFCSKWLKPQDDANNLPNAFLGVILFLFCLHLCQQERPMLNYNKWCRWKPSSPGAIPFLPLS